MILSYFSFLKCYLREIYIGNFTNGIVKLLYAHTRTIYIYIYKELAWEDQSKKSVLYLPYKHNCSIIGPI